MSSKGSDTVEPHIELLFALKIIVLNYLTLGPLMNTNNCFNRGIGFFVSFVAGDFLSSLISSEKKKDEKV